MERGITCIMQLGIMPRSKKLIKSEKQLDCQPIKPAFCNRRRTVDSISLKEASVTAERAMNMRRQPGTISGKRGVIASLSLRFTRLRVTALPIFFPTANPILISGTPACIWINTSVRLPVDLPLLYTRRNSLFRLRE